MKTGNQDLPLKPLDHVCDECGHKRARTVADSHPSTCRVRLLLETVEALMARSISGKAPESGQA